MQRRGKPSLELRTPGDKDAPNTPRKIVTVGEHHEGSGRLYMAHKMLKLRDQFDGAKSCLTGEQAEAVSGIFNGVVVYVNGYTEPPPEVLKDLMAQRGGRVDAYYTPDVTHMVANVLPETKLKELRKLKRPPMVVVAKWITDSVAAARLLPTGPYTVPGLAPQKAGIGSFLRTVPSATAPLEAAAAPACPVPHAAAGSGSQGPAIAAGFSQNGKRSSSAGSAGASLPAGFVVSGSDLEAAQLQRHLQQQQQQMVMQQQQQQKKKPPEQLQHHQRNQALPQECQQQHAPEQHHHQLQQHQQLPHSQQQQEQPQQQANERQHPEQGLPGPGARARVINPYAPRPRSSTPGIGASTSTITRTALPPGSEPGPAAMQRAPAEEAQVGGPEQPYHGASSAAPIVRQTSSSSSNACDQRTSDAQETGSKRPFESSASSSSCTPEKQVQQQREQQQQQQLVNGTSSPAADTGSAGASPSATSLGRARAEGGDSKRRRYEWGQPRTSREDPDFVATFFRHSRLHHIGHFTARYSKMAAEYLRERDATGGKAVYNGPLGEGPTRVVLHVDMDCFFVSVMIRDRPELKSKAVAVAHTGGTTPSTGIGSSSEISSCSYAAREKGVRAGMPMGHAKELCPELMVLPYDFEAFDEVSDQVYRVFHRLAPVVQAVSCDEAFLELPAGCDAMRVATQVRSEILERTRCPCSAGAGSSILLARLATKRAKPNGQCQLSQEDALAMLADMPVKELPGVGYKLAERLAQHNITQCRHVQASTQEQLQSLFGNKTGKLLWTFAHGEDTRPVVPYTPRKSLGAEVSWGVRFDDQAGANEFLTKLSGEVAVRLKDQGCKGRTITLSLKRQRQGAPEPAKHLGHGICDNFSRSTTLAAAEDSPAPIAAAAIALLLGLNCPSKEIRGLGVHLTRLVDAATGVPLAEGTGAAKPKEAAMMSSWLQKKGTADQSPDRLLEHSLEPPFSLDAQEESAEATNSSGRADLTIDLEPVAMVGTSDSDAGGSGGRTSLAADATPAAAGAPRARAAGNGKGKARAAIQTWGEGNDMEDADSERSFFHRQQQQQDLAFAMPAPPPRRPTQQQQQHRRWDGGGSSTDILPPSPESISLSQVTMSQIDPSYLAELPSDVRSQVLATVAHAARQSAHGPPSEAPPHAPTALTAAAAAARNSDDGGNQRHGSSSSSSRGGSNIGGGDSAGGSGSGRSGGGSSSNSGFAAMNEEDEVVMLATPTREEPQQRPQTLQLFPESMSQIDPEALGALSEDLREEVLRDLRANQPQQTAHRLQQSPPQSKLTPPKARPTPPKGAKRGKGGGARPKGWQPELGALMRLQASSEGVKGLDPDVFANLPLGMRLKLAGMTEQQRLRADQWDEPPAKKKLHVSRGMPPGINQVPAAIVGDGVTDMSVEGAVEIGDMDAGDAFGAASPVPVQGGDSTRIKVKATTGPTQGAVFEAEPASQVRAPLTTWLQASIKESATASPSHLAIMYEFVSVLVDDNRLDEAATCMRCVKRILTDAPPSWWRAFEALDAAVQAFVGKKQGGVYLCYD